MKPRVIVIVGPTCSGKSSLAIEVARKVNGAIISADSMQIYKGMDIGTAKVKKDEMQGIKHYMIDIVSPNEKYNVSMYKKQAEICIEEIILNNQVAIIVGGTGLYVDSLVKGIEFREEDVDEAYRNELNKIAEDGGLSTLYEKAKNIDEEAMRKISQNDKKRIIRVLEIYHNTGKTKTEQDRLSRQNPVPYEYMIYGIKTGREMLYQNINTRVDEMIKEGLIEEVECIIRKYDSFPTAMQGLGYKETVEYLRGGISKEEMIEKIKMETRRYAKRQLTWFNSNKSIFWVERRRRK